MKSSRATLRSRLDRAIAIAGASLFAAGLSLAAIGCSSEPSAPAIPPPLAGFQHAAVVRVGEAVSFDAQPTRAGALFDKEGGIVDEAAVVAYRFLAADGSPDEEVATPAWQHTFTKPGLYAVSLTVRDDLGRTSTARSVIHATADYTATCTTAAEAASCDSGRCMGDVCSEIACGGQAVCPSGTTCAEGKCYVTPPAPKGDDLVDGADAGAAAGADAGAAQGDATP